MFICMCARVCLVVYVYGSFVRTRMCSNNISTVCVGACEWNCNEENMTEPQSTVKGNIIWTSVDPRWCPSLMHESVIYWTSARMHACVSVCVCVHALFCVSPCVCVCVHLHSPHCLLSLNNHIKHEANPISSNLLNTFLIHPLIKKIKHMY